VKVALQFLRRQQAKTITVAIPVGPPETILSLKKDADQIVCLAKPEPFYAIGEFYENFDQTTDQEVMELLKQNRRR
jgi:putative phosphoribosyl transferase